MNKLLKYIIIRIHNLKSDAYIAQIEPLQNLKKTSKQRHIVVKIASPWQIYKHLSAIVHDILIAFLSFYIHLGYYKNMAVCIYTSRDLWSALLHVNK